VVAGAFAGSTFDDGLSDSFRRWSYQPRHAAVPRLLPILLAIAAWLWPADLRRARGRHGYPRQRRSVRVVWRRPAAWPGRRAIAAMSWTGSSTYRPVSSIESLLDAGPWADPEPARHLSLLAGSYPPPVRGNRAWRDAA
jgi:hypothetical protein